MFLMTEAKDGKVAREIWLALEKPWRDQGRYPDLTSLGAEARALRRALTKGLNQLQALKPSHGQRDDYSTLSERIRAYIAKQVADESIMAGSPEIKASVENNSPMGRLASPDEMAEAAIWLASASPAMLMVMR